MTAAATSSVSPYSFIPAHLACLIGCPSEINSRALARGAQGAAPFWSAVNSPEATPSDSSASPGTPVTLPASLSEESQRCPGWRARPGSPAPCPEWPARRGRPGLGARRDRACTRRRPPAGRPRGAGPRDGARPEQPRHRAGQVHDGGRHIAGAGPAVQVDRHALAEFSSAASTLVGAVSAAAYFALVTTSGPVFLSRPRATWCSGIRIPTCPSSRRCPRPGSGWT